MVFVSERVKESEGGTGREGGVGFGGLGSIGDWFGEAVGMRRVKVREEDGGGEADDDDRDDEGGLLPQWLAGAWPAGAGLDSLWKP